MTINIDPASCIRCGKCVKICPAAIFTQTQIGQPVKQQQQQNCIACGHCVAVCPTNSVLHTLFPPEKTHTIDYTSLPTPQQIMLLCKTRRSNRTITTQPVPPEMLDMILQAAHQAPTATNAQTVSFTLVTNPAKLQEISDHTINTFNTVANKLRNPLLKPFLKHLLPDIYKHLPVLERLNSEHKAGNDPILRHATALLLIHTPKSNRFGAQDANLAYQNGSLMAESLGVSQIYMGFILSAIKQDKQNKIPKTLDIHENIHAIMALGIPAFRYPKYIDRKDINLTKK